MGVCVLCVEGTGYDSYGGEPSAVTDREEMSCQHQRVTRQKSLYIISEQEVVTPSHWLHVNSHTESLSGAFRYLL